MDRTLADELAEATILIVDDDEDNLFLLSRMLRQYGCERLTLVSDPYQAQSECRRVQPDLILLDYRLPPTNGFEVIAEIWQGLDVTTRPPVVMLTGSATEQIRKQAFDLGVSDFLYKDFDSTELLIRVRNVLRVSRLHRQVQRQRDWLEEMVRIRTRELEDARREILERLAMAAEFRDDQTGEHTQRVGTLSSRIAEALRQPRAFVDAIASAALLHDLGKIGVPDSVLLKPGRLTPAEFSHIRAHPDIGASILTGCTEPVLAMAREIALTHHERWDGNGYPQGLVAEEIPLSGRIVAVADAYDAMTSTRPYKAAVPPEAAIAEIERSAGNHFDPRVVQAFLSIPLTELP
ncbi:MAG: HD domain-containing phosphohydrolase [Fimbriimonas sp.]